MKHLAESSWLMLLCMGALASGCVEPPESSVSFSVKPEGLRAIKRVVFIELSDRDRSPDVAEGMTKALASAIRSRKLFSLDVVSRDDPRCKLVTLDQQGGFTLRQLRQLRDTFDCQAVLVGWTKDYYPHPRMQVGLRLQLLDLRQGQAVWAVDDVWDTTDKAMEKRVKRFFREQMRSGYEPMGWQLVLTSPKAFEKFVAHEVAETLPNKPEIQPVNTPKR